MAQSNYNVPNDTAPFVRNRLNDIFLSIATNNSGPTEPATTFPHQWWYDTNIGILKQRNASNTAWSFFGDREAGELGSYAFLRPATTSVLTEGTILAGSSLRYANSSGGFRDVAPQGGWRLMGVVGNDRSGLGSSSLEFQSSLWLRIA